MDVVDAAIEAQIEIGRTVARQQEILTERSGGVARLGLEAEHVSWASQQRYASEWFPRSELVPTSGLVEALRLVKDDGEVARIEAACGIADAALATVAPMLEAKIIEAAEVVIQRRAGEAAVEMQKALLELNQLMGRRADEPLQVRRTEFPAPKAAELVALLNRAAANNFDLRVRRAELEQQGLKVSLAKNERYPTFTVGPNVSQERAGDRETVIGLSLSMPLPVWDNGQAAVNASQARRMQAEASLLGTMREVERQITEAWLLLGTQQKRLDGWKPDSLQSFAEAARLADRHYRLGAVPLSTYLEMQDKYLEATEAINATRLEVLRASLDLEQLVGASAPQTTKSK